MEDFEPDLSAVRSSLRHDPTFWDEVHHGTSAKPGSALKIDVFAARYAAGLPLHHANDHRPTYGTEADAERQTNPFFWADGTPPSELPEAPEEGIVD
jgi:hypothetical protein